MQLSISSALLGRRGWCTGKYFMTHAYGILITIERQTNRTRGIKTARSIHHTHTRTVGKEHVSRQLLALQEPSANVSYNSVQNGLVYFIAVCMHICVMRCCTPGRDFHKQTKL